MLLDTAIITIQRNFLIKSISHKYHKCKNIFDNMDFYSYINLDWLII